MKINLKKRKLKNGKLSLYLEYYKGYSIDSDGKKKHNRDFEYLKLYLHQDPNNATEKKENKETLQLAEKILTIRQADHIKGKYNIKDNEKSKTLFLEYYNKLKEERYESKGNYDNWDAAYKHIERYCPPQKMLRDIDEDFV